MAQHEQNPPPDRTPSSGHGSTGLVETLRKLAGADPSQSTEALATFLENSPDPVLLFCNSGEIIAKNQRASEFWDGDDDFIPPRLLHEVTKVNASGSRFQEDKKSRLIPIDACGGRRYFLPTVFRLCENHENNGGTACCHRVVACILKDETIWERSEQIRKNLLASISHELNTPLTSARLSLYLLSEQQIGELNENQSDLVERAKQDLDREILSIQNVLDMIRSDEVERDPSATEDLNLHELIEETIARLDAQIQSMHLPVQRNYSATSPWITMDRDTAELVLHQLFASILNYTEENAPLTVETSIEDGHCRLEITTKTDEQTDFLPDDLFTLGMESPRTRQLRCADLGLRIAHEMIAPHGGSIGSEYLETSGRLRFRFPCSRK